MCLTQKFGKLEGLIPAHVEFVTRGGAIEYETESEAEEAVGLMVMNTILAYELSRNHKCNSKDHTYFKVIKNMTLNNYFKPYLWFKGTTMYHISNEDEQWELFWNDMRLNQNLTNKKYDLDVRWKKEEHGLSTIDEEF